MDQGLKERLIGAAVLVALAVWLIPWLLDGPDEPITADGGTLELPVPSGHVGEVRTEVIDLASRRDGGRASATGAGRATDPASTRPADASTSRGEPAAATAQSAATGGGAPAAGGDAARSTADTGTAAAASTATPTSDGARATDSSGARASASSNSPSASASSNAAPSEPRTSAATQASTSGTTSAAAASASARPASAARAEPSASGDWAVQVGSFSEEENARRHAARVSSLGYSPKISTFRAGGRVMYRVRIGPHETRQAAEAVASALAAHGFVAQVVTNN